MKHKHYEMIVAKAADMDLVVFYKGSGVWIPCASPYLPDFDCSDEYFLCLPQHKEACFHWLNGGEVQVRYPEKSWVDLDNYEDDTRWLHDADFMLDDCEIRIKPKKVKRWIALDSEGYVMPMHCDSEESARAHASHAVRLIKDSTQFIEIEIEV